MCLVVFDAVLGGLHRSLVVFYSTEALHFRLVHTFASLIITRIGVLLRHAQVLPLAVRTQAASAECRHLVGQHADHHWVWSYQTSQLYPMSCHRVSSVFGQYD